MDSGIWIYIIWTIGAGALGLIISAIFAGILHLRRSIFLVPYVLIIGFLLYGYYRWANLDLSELIIHNWVWGLIAALIATVLTVRNIFTQASSPRPQGLRLVFEVLWFGVIYGALDGLYLSVLPVLVTWKAFPDLGGTILGKVCLGLLALIASEFITIAYHAGYPEFRNSKISMAAIGNGIFTLGYIFSMNPISAVGAHLLMHVAAVWRGSEKTVQLPPHY
ncbi:hypothetical protein JW758_00165 [Candidatus Peregrinibacteria bacterium]|nr:hypothetical protein [Candidatus Peregrinibacteria bacterium]